MKIGEFSKLYNVSRDTIRFYCKMGLLTPNTSGTQAEFSERDCQDMEKILRMKEQHFSLQEIYHFFDIFRVSNMVEPESIYDITEMFQRKRRELEAEAQKMLAICDEIDQDVKALTTGMEKSLFPSGVPLQALSLLTCPHCGKALSLDGASISQNYILQGHLFCPCGYEAKIEDGIVNTGNAYRGEYDSPDLKRGLYRQVADGFITSLQHCNDKALRKLRSMNLKGKVVSEGHINGYFFLYNQLVHLDPDSIYIIFDKYPEMLQMYKKNIEQLGLRLNILYIADAGLELPLKSECIDVMISFMGDTEHSLYFKNSYIHDMKPYLAKDAMVVGTSLGFAKNAKSLKLLAQKYPEGGGRYFCSEELMLSYQKEGYVYTEIPVGVFKKTENKYSFECHKDGESLTMTSFCAVPLKLN